MWYYIGPHGQIGPLGDQQIRNLVHGHIIGPQTPVWRQGMTDWLPAGHVPELAVYFTQGGWMGGHPQPIHTQPGAFVQYSNRSRVAAGVLNLLVPGVGRLYLGYITLGILQLVACIGSLTFCCAGGIWGFVDGLLILSGGVDRDGEGLPLRN